MSYHRTSEAAPPCGAATMTVCTNHLALCHLVENALPGSVPETRSDAELLVPKVVELEHDRIALAAVRARVLAQIGDQVLDPLRDERLLASSGRIDISLAIRRVVLLLVGGPTGAAVVIALASGFPTPGEVLRLLFVSAPPAPPHSLSLRIRTDVPCVFCVSVGNRAGLSAPAKPPGRRCAKMQAAATGSGAVW